MNKNYFDITLALAGVCQSARLVQQLAYQSQCDEQPLRISLQSLLDLNPPSVSAVYGDNLLHLRMGLETLQNLLKISSRGKLSNELIKYTLGMMVLERRLNDNRGAQIELSHRIDALYSQHSQLSHLDSLSDSFINAIGSIYLDVISPFKPRIHIIGAPLVLQQTKIQTKVRAVLLAGIRSAVLWKQVGGGKFQLIFARNQLSKKVKQILLNI